jgi:hypothetical protein
MLKRKHTRTHAHTRTRKGGLPGVLSVTTNLVPSCKAVVQRCRESVTSLVEGHLPDSLQQPQVCVVPTAFVNAAMYNA